MNEKSFSSSKNDLKECLNKAIQKEKKVIKEKNKYIKKLRSQLVNMQRLQKLQEVKK